jgi:hypothetical protein
MLVGGVVALTSAVIHSGIGVFIAVGFLLVRSLLRLAFRLIVTLVYILFIVLILSLIIL